MSTRTRKSRWAAAVDRVAAIDDGTILKTAFYGMLAATVVVIGIDYFDRSAQQARETPVVPPEMVDPANPVLPSVERPEIDPDDPAYRPTEQITSPPERLAAPLEIALIRGGVLALTGTIDPGSAERFAAEIAARGEYVSSIALDSPGGAVEDALAIARAIRAAGYDTAVGDGALCASSCPLVLAAGDRRLVADSAAIGVHQIYAAVSPESEGRLVPAQVMSDAQTTTARITRHLTEMDVDPALWLHALDTPPDRLYYFTPEELETYRLSTSVEEEEVQAIEALPDAPDAEAVEDALPGQPVGNGEV